MRIGYEEIIKINWEYSLEGSAMYTMIRKLQKCVKELNSWARQTFGNNKKILAELIEIQMLEATEENLRVEAKVSFEIDSIRCREEKYWKQRARIIGWK